MVGWFGVFFFSLVVQTIPVFRKMPLNEEDEQKATFSKTFTYTMQLNDSQNTAARHSRSRALPLPNFKCPGAAGARGRSGSASSRRGTVGPTQRGSLPPVAPPRPERLEAHPRRGRSAERRREPAFPPAVPGELPAPQPAPATHLAFCRGRGSLRPAGSCPDRALGREGRAARRRRAPPGSAGHMAWCGRGAPSGAPRPPSPSRAAAWPGGGAAAERPLGPRRRSPQALRGAAPVSGFYRRRKEGCGEGATPPRSRRG